MTLRARVKQFFSIPPCSFQFEADDSKAVHNGISTLQCKTEHTATLFCRMPRDQPDVVAFNTNELVLLLLVAGWKEGDAWLAECMRAAPKRQDDAPFMTIHDGMRYELIIMRHFQNVVLTVTESTV
jgi:hypothetical protein